MGKKKPAEKKTPESTNDWKEFGNEAFAEGKYQLAVNAYTNAIAFSIERKESEDQRHIYFSNRANAYLQLKMFKECITDCTLALKDNPKYVKALLRRAMASYEI
jgi:tetratricopeptide (TPR) repeat protein